MRAVVYARVSTEHEAQINALENQLEWYKIEASRHSTGKLQRSMWIRHHRNAGAEKAGVPTYDGGCQKR